MCLFLFRRFVVLYKFMLKIQLNNFSGSIFTCKETKKYSCTYCKTPPKYTFIYLHNNN